MGPPRLLVWPNLMPVSLTESVVHYRKRRTIISARG
jgi:hypothetical protein